MRYFGIGISIIVLCVLVILGFRSAFIPAAAKTAAALLQPSQSEQQTAQVRSTVVPSPPVNENVPAETALAQCGQRWADKPPDVRQQCSNLKETVIVERRATAAAVPRPTRIARTPDPEIYGTALPSGFIPEEAKRIESMPARDQAGGDLEIRTATSVWRFGAVLDEQGEYHRMLLWASPGGRSGHPSLGISFCDAPASLRKQWAQVWECPEAIGDITNTGITGQQGVVMFKTTSGKVGTFDLRTHQWSL
jgi:hypothetical protein